MWGSGSVQRYFRAFLLVCVVVAGGFLAFFLTDPRTYLDWPRAQGFVAKTAEIYEPGLGPLTASQRALDSENPRPSPGAAAGVIIAAQGGSLFPILLPHGFGVSDETVSLSRLRLRLLEDGYYTVFQTVTMEITIIGTQTTWHNEASLQVSDQADYVMPFEDPGSIPAGGAITFGHFGADYSVTFDCIDTSPGLAKNCITKEKAERFVASLTAGLPTGLQIPPALAS